MAENLCYTALKKFRQQYGIIPNVSDKEFFTNSMHVPVWHQLSPFEKIDIESQLTGYSSAGCITYVELDASAVHNTKALEQIVVNVSFFAQGCPFHCKGCHNPETWNFNGGKEFSESTLEEIINSLKANGV